MTTLDMTAPDGSVTVPRIVPKMVCPSPGVARHTARATLLKAMTKGLIFMIKPLSTHFSAAQRTAGEETLGRGPQDRGEAYFRNATESRRKTVPIPSHRCGVN